jgi:hypothetical protein
MRFGGGSDGTDIDTIERMSARVDQNRLFIHT